MTEKCLDFRMNLKSEMTAIIYADNNINNLVHNKINEWYNIILNSIYSNDQIKSLIVSFLQHKQIIMPDSAENLKKFIHDTFSMTDLNEDQKAKRENKILETFSLYGGQTQNLPYLFHNSSVFDLFFIIYLKGGMATRFICMLLNTLSGGNMFPAELLHEQLGAVSDYDFNCIINPTFERPVYDTFYTTLKNLLTNVFAHLTTDPFFNDQFIKENLIKDASAAAAKFPIIYSSSCNPIINQPLGYSSSMEITQKFGLVRLMAQVQVICSGSICFKDESGYGKNTVAINAELIDISLPLFDNLEERNHAWIFGNKAVCIKWCSIQHNSCNITNDNEKYSLTDKIRVYSLHSAIDDLTTTIRETEQRGDTAKIAKRKKRLDFFKQLICQYTLLVNSTDGTINEADLSKYCVVNVEGLLCGNEYIDEDTSLILAQFSMGLAQDSNLVFGIMDKYINYIITYSNNPADYKSQLLASFGQDYRKFLNSLNVDQLNQIKPAFCNLLINAISLNKSLNDNFIIAFIGFLLLHTLSILWFNYSVFINETVKFNKKLIESMEFFNNNTTRPVINAYFNSIMENLWALFKNIYRPDETVQILIRGGCAVHMNIILDQTITKSTPANMNTNDIDLVINVERYDDQLIIGLQSLFENILADLRQRFSNLDLKFEYVIAGQLFQVIMDYDSRIYPSDFAIYTSFGPINVHSLIPRIRHHIVEINFLNTQPYSEDQIIHLYPKDGNRECVFYNVGFLIKEYNKLLMESKHWYRKSKYLRRIAALNRVITDYPARKNYESEFPLPC